MKYYYIEEHLPAIPPDQGYAWLCVTDTRVLFFNICYLIWAKINKREVRLNYYKAFRY